MPLQVLIQSLIIHPLIGFERIYECIMQEQRPKKDFQPHIRKKKKRNEEQNKAVFGGKSKIHLQKSQRQNNIKESEDIPFYTPKKKKKDPPFSYIF